MKKGISLYSIVTYILEGQSKPHDDIGNLISIHYSNQTASIRTNFPIEPCWTIFFKLF